MGRVLLLALAAGWGCSGNDGALPTASSFGSEKSAASNLSAAAVSGLVTDALDGRPLGGITVEIPGVASATTGGDGAFTLEASVWMQKRYHKDDRQVFSHELAHALGFTHPAGSENVPLRSIMRNAEDVTSHDILHGRILYRRPPGIRTADKDPEGFWINALRAEAEAGPPDPSRIRWVRD
jgi:hypothetical protein